MKKILAVLLFTTLVSCLRTQIPNGKVVLLELDTNLIKAGGSFDMLKWGSTSPAVGCPRGSHIIIIEQYFETDFLPKDSPVVIDRRELDVDEARSLMDQCTSSSDPYVASFKIEFKKNGKRIIDDLTMNKTLRIAAVRQSSTVDFDLKGIDLTLKFPIKNYFYDQQVEYIKSYINKKYGADCCTYSYYADVGTD